MGERRRGGGSAEGAEREGEKGTRRSRRRERDLLTCEGELGISVVSSVVRKRSIANKYKYRTNNHFRFGKRRNKV